MQGVSGLFSVLTFAASQCLNAAPPVGDKRTGGGGRRARCNLPPCSFVTLHRYMALALMSISHRHPARHSRRNVPGETTFSAEVA